MGNREPSPGGEGPLLEYLGSGAQSHVFGAEAWVVAVPRVTVRSVLARALTSRERMRQVQAHLGGLVAPFILLDRCRFRSALPGSAGVRVFDRRLAVARPRFSPERFLGARLAAAEPARAVDDLERMVALLEQLRARGFIMLDFIMRNFVFVGETLKVSDPGLVVPVGDLSWHPSRFTALGFGIGLTRDYLRLCAGLERRCADARTRARVRGFAECLPARLRALRDRSGEIERSEWCAVDFPEGLEEAIRAAIGVVPPRAAPPIPP